MFHKNRTKRKLSPLLEIGFHGDVYLLGLVDTLIKDCDYFIETGTNVGSTIAHVARSFKHIKCLSCEPDKSAFHAAVKNTSKYPNVTIYNKTSQQFIDLIKYKKRALFNKKILFWLDAHGYGFKWPLREEVEFITSTFTGGFLLIDDFLVPGKENIFKFDTYQNQECSFQFIENYLKCNYSVFYPKYTGHTSKYHPLTGWCCIAFGNCKDISIDYALEDIIIKSIVN
ncbi:MAG: hypothetical protein PF690_15435 [Deltaproteobacteria bacterium]|nr:hypothetical protein [Deltaproteobacteria bacterium]